MDEDHGDSAGSAGASVDGQGRAGAGGERQLRPERLPRQARNAGEATDAAGEARRIRGRRSSRRACRSRRRSTATRNRHGRSIPQFGKDHAAVFEMVTAGSRRRHAALTFTLEFAQQRRAQHRPAAAVGDATKHAGLDRAPACAAASGALRCSQVTAGKRTAEQRACPAEVVSHDRSRVAGGLNDRRPTSTGEGAEAGDGQGLIASEGVPAVRLHTQGERLLRADVLPPPRRPGATSKASRRRASCRC